jgi:hypothetical protein
MGVNMPKTMTEIKYEINTKNTEIRELQKDLELIKKHCPHPKYFLSCSISDSEDTTGGGVGTYECSYVKYKCSLCEASFTESFNKEKGPAPTLEECINVRS